MLRFVHAADLHLDSPFEGLAAQDERVAGLLRQSTLAAYERLIALCLRERVDFLLVAGDVFDGERRTLRAQVQFQKGLRQLADAGIACYVVHGNHDPLDAWASHPAPHPLIHDFTNDFAAGAQVLPFRRPGADTVLAQVVGVSYAHRVEERQLWRLYKTALAATPTLPGVPTIALLHGNVGAVGEHANYAPATLDDLRSVPVDYWALGHVHTRAVLGERPYVVYPGNPQARHVREAGPRGAYVVELDDARHATLRFVPLDGVRFHLLDVPLGAATDLPGLVASAARAVRALREQEQRHVLVRLTISGSGPLHAQTRAAGGAEELATLLREELAGDEPLAWIERVTVATRATVDLARRREGDDLLAQVLKVAEELRAGGTVEPSLRPALASLYEHYRASKLLDPPTAAALSTWLADAEYLCHDLLEGND